MTIPSGISQNGSEFASSTSMVDVSSISHRARRPFADRELSFETFDPGVTAFIAQSAVGFQWI
jgi:hypothetical protein